MNLVRIDYWESAELAAAILGIDPPDSDKDVEKVEGDFIDKYQVDLDTLAKITEKLVPMCACDKSPLTGSFRRGFFRDGAYIVKETIQEGS